MVSPSALLRVFVPVLIYCNPSRRATLSVFLVIMAARSSESRRSTCPLTVPVTVSRLCELKVLCGELNHPRVRRGVTRRAVLRAPPQLSLSVALTRRGRIAAAWFAGKGVRERTSSDLSREIVCAREVWLLGARALCLAQDS